MNVHAPPRSTVEVVSPPAYTDEHTERLTQLLGEPPLPVPEIALSSILVDGRFHTASNRWLTTRRAKAPRTIEENARDLAAWIDYLRNEHGLTGPDEANADVFAATEDHLLAYHAKLQHQPGTRISPDAWRKRLSVIKQFHEYAQQRYGLRPPFHLKTVFTASGAKVTTTGLAPRVRKNSVGSPVDPYYANDLVQGAWRIDANGEEHGDECVERDAAYISFGLGSGARRHTLFGLTIHELPPPRTGVINVMRIPDLITKGDAGGDALVFEHRLQPVRDYISGARTDLAALSRKHFHPDDPLVITEADTHQWRAVDHAGRPRRGRWNDTTIDDRLQMVHDDGTSPMVWLNTRNGCPLGYRQLHRIVATAASFTRSHINPGFPARFRPHDLRHTFAVHMAVAIVRGRIERDIAGPAARAYATPLVRDAVHIVCASMGHTNPQTTTTYLTHATSQLLSGIPIDAYLGDR